MSSDDGCNLTALALGLSFSIDHHNQNPQVIKEKEIKEHKESGLKFDNALPSLSLGSQQEEINIACFQTPSNISPDGSSYSNSCSVVKKLKEKVGVVIHEDFEVEKAAVSSRGSDEDEEASPRKKLRLTKEQSAVLEDSFKEHSTLNPNEKQALARQLKLRPRQVEVWFQNRRARTKLKQTEMDCELLKKCCENLTEENKRLHRELQELRALKLVGPTTTPAATVFMQMPAATLSMCPSCDRINTANTTTGGGGAGGNRFVRSC